MAYFPSQTEYYEAEVQDPSSGSIGSGIGTGLGILGGALIGVATLGTATPAVLAASGAVLTPAVPAAMGAGAAASLGGSLGASFGGGIGGSIGLAAGKEKKMLPVGTSPPGQVDSFSPSQLINSDLGKGVMEYMKYKDRQKQEEVLPPVPAPFPDEEPWEQGVG